MSRVVDSYSDVEMACPSDVENGHKEPFVKRPGTGIRRASNRRTGEWTGSTYETEFIDDGRFRQQLVSPVDRYWQGAHVVKMTNRANRAAKGAWYTVFTGPLIDAQPTRPKGMSVTLGDLVSSLILSDQAILPYRIIGDGMLGQLTSVSENLDLQTPEPTIYGQHRRVPDVDVASQFGFCVLPTYLGIQDVSATAYHVWLVAGHACADIPTWRVDGSDRSADEGTQWMVPHWPSHNAQFGAVYNDYVDNFGITRRYTLIRGLVTDMFADEADLTDPDACALGRRQLTVAVDGVESVGDGSGECELDRIQQYKHWMVNYVAHRGADSYHSGDWLTCPLWDAFGASIAMIDLASFDACSALGVIRLPDAGGSPAVTPGYIGAAVIGANGERSSVRDWIAAWNRSCDVQNVITRYGQYRVFMMSPTETIKAAATLYTDVLDMLRDSFEAPMDWPAQAFRVPFQGDKNPSTAVWTTSDSAVNTVVRDLYGGRDITSETIDYPFAPGITALNHLAQIELHRSLHPPRMVGFRAPVGPNHNGDSLAYREAGDYIRYKAFPAVATSATEIRLAQLVSIGVDVERREVIAEAIDCEDLIGYDRPGSP